MALPVVLVLEWYAASRDYVLCRLLACKAERWVDVLPCQNLEQAVSITKEIGPCIRLIIIDDDGLQGSAHDAVIQLRTTIPNSTKFIVIGQPPRGEPPDWGALGARFFLKSAPEQEIEGFLRRYFEQLERLAAAGRPRDSTIVHK